MLSILRSNGGRPLEYLDDLERHDEGQRDEEAEQGEVRGEALERHHPVAAGVSLAKLQLFE
jgi:hypothetical protein